MSKGEFKSGSHMGAFKLLPVLLSSRDLGSRALLPTKLVKARSLLYRSRFLHPNTQFSAFVKIYANI
jgi:hypothetical protein